MRCEMRPAKAVFQWLAWIAAFAPASLAAREVPSFAPLVGADAGRSEGQWAPSLRDPTAPLIKSRPASEGAAALEPVRRTLRRHGFRHEAFERFCEAIGSASGEGASRATDQCLT